LQSDSGDFVWLANFVAYAKTPALLGSLWNSLWVSALVTLIVLPLAFSFAYALTRSCMPYKALVSRHHPGAFAGTVTAVSDFADLLVWQSGCAQNLVARHGYRRNLRRTRRGTG
jgi:ABC-type sugar transport system permease subunit